MIGALMPGSADVLARCIRHGAESFKDVGVVGRAAEVGRDDRVVAKHLGHERILAATEIQILQRAVSLQQGPAFTTLILFKFVFGLAWIL